MGKRIFYAVLLLAVIGTCILAMGKNLKNNKSEQQKPYYATLVNGTGKTITRITFRTEQAAAGKEASDSGFMLAVELKDKDVTAVTLPSELRQYDSIGIEIEFDDGKVAKMKKNEAIALSDEQTENVFLLSIKGKKSTVPLVAAGTAGGVTVGAIAATSAYCAAQWGAGGITWLLATVGGTMATGIAVAAVAPVAVAAATAGTVFAVQHFFLPETLEIQRLSSDQALFLPTNN